VDQEVLRDGTADVMTRYGDGPGELQRGSEARHPVREGRDRARFQGEFTSRAPKSGKVDRDGSYPRRAQTVHHREPDPAPVGPVQQEHGRAVLLHGQVAGRLAVDLDLGPHHRRFDDFAHAPTVAEAGLPAESLE
jgi:hypothetical protein